MSSFKMMVAAVPYVVDVATRFPVSSAVSCQSPPAESARVRIVGASIESEKEASPGSKSICNLEKNIRSPSWEILGVILTR